MFEYFSNGTHRCVPAQHLAAVGPADLALLSAGSLPDLFLAVVEQDCGLRIFVDKGEFRTGGIIFMGWTLLGFCFIKKNAAQSGRVFDLLEPLLFVYQSIVYGVHVTREQTANPKLKLDKHHKTAELPSR